MATLQAGSILRQLRRAAFHTDGADLTDGQLLRSFLHRHDQAAFEALARRHGPMVRGVCRRVLRNVHDADDAFQAAFLVLIRKANSLIEREVVGDWLHGVAYRVALKARTAEATRRGKERLALRAEAQEEEGRPEWLPLLDQEIGRLPEKYRLPVVLCDLEGRTRKEAARQLGWPEGTLAGRLARARALLAKRLTRRGVTLSAAALASALTGEAVASLPISLVRSTSRAAIAFAAGQTAGAISAPVAALTEGVVKAMMLAKWKPTLMLLMVVLAVTIGVGAWRHAATAGPAEKPQQEKPVEAPRDKPVPPVPVGNRSFQIDLSIARGKSSHRKVVDARLIAPEGKVASFADSKAFEFQVGGGKTDSVVMGPTILLVVRTDYQGKVALDMTVNQPKNVTSGLGDTMVESESIRVIRIIELGEFVTAKLDTGTEHSSFVEVTARVREAKEDPRGKTVAAAESDLQMAEFYRRTGHPDSARYYYELIRRRYPNTIYDERAKERLDELKKQPSKPAKAEEKPPARVGQIFIIGNTRTRQSVILKQVPLYPGQILSYPDLEIAERNLSRIQSIKSAKVKVIESEDSNPYKDIRIDIEEK